MNPKATGGNEPKSRPVKEFMDAKKLAIKERPRPAKKVVRYTVDANGNVVMTMADFTNAIMAREEHEMHLADLKLWYEQQGVPQEPMFRDETLEQYKSRTGSKG